MAQNLIVKLHFGTDIRRFSSTNPSDLSWTALSERINKFFELPEKKKFKVTYVDDEKDVITLSTDDELKEAVALALTSEPSILRLTITKNEKDKKTVASEGTNTKPVDVKPAEAKPGAPAEAAAPFGGVPPEIAPFLESLAKQLPAAMATMPDALKAMLPHAELDLAATLAANTPAGRQADSYCPAEPHAAGAAEGVHEGVTCDKTGACPIVGNRYHLVGHNYDLCEAEFLKLSDKEKALFRKVAPPAAPKAAPKNAPTDGAAAPAPADAATGVHPGVTCDRSGMSPIVGLRYHLRGHNYDLCQAEFDKLPDVEKALYAAMPPPAACGGGAWRPGHPWGWKEGPWRPGPHWKGHGGMGCHGKGGDGFPKLAARFVRDVTIFDGTQMAPGTVFTKIWRLKNVGEVPWPPGARMLFVGGDQMTTEMSVPLSRASAVLPGEEVDVAVEMTAPKEHGRYLGYWRLTGPYMRKKFGQRVWCHVQVVDPTQSGAEAFDDLPTTLAEIERKKSDLAAADEHEPADDELEPANEKPTDEPTAAETAAPPVDVSEAASAPAAGAADKVADEAAEEPSKDGSASDDGVLVTDGMLLDATAADVAGAPGPSGATPLGVRAELGAMGFTDEAMVDAVVTKNGEDVEACARDLAAATEWAHLLDDLAEMGFANRELNMSLMLKNGGNMKRSVRDLVEA